MLLSFFFAILAWFTAFHVFCSASGFSLHLDDLLELFLTFCVF
jgi:hypothetical protein